MLNDMNQPAKAWWADCLENFSQQMRDGAEPILTLNLMGAEVEVRLTGLPDAQQAQGQGGEG